MERGWIERIRKMSNEKLLREAKRKGSRNIIAAEEIFSRISKGRITDEDKYLRAILESIKAGGGPEVQRKSEETKEKASKIMIEKGYLDERNLSTILREIDSQKILERTVRKCLAKDINIPNYVLREAVSRIKLSSLKQVLARKLLDQNPSTDDFLVIEGELEDLKRFPKGSPLQIEALEKHWETGIKTEDACWLIGFVPSLAERTWERLCRERRVKDLSMEELDEIFRYTDSPKIKIGAGKKLLPQIKKKLKRARKVLKKKPRDAEALLQINYLEKDVEKLRKEVENRLNDGKTGNIEIYITPQT